VNFAAESSLLDAICLAAFSISGFFSFAICFFFSHENHENQIAAATAIDTVAMLAKVMTPTSALGGGAGANWGG
jgi:hypothetical protein